MRFGQSLICLLIGATGLWAQSAPEPLKAAEASTYRDLKSLRTPVDTGDAAKTAEHRQILAKQAKFMVGQLTDPRRVSNNDFARIIEDAIRDQLPVYVDNRPKEIPAANVTFSLEMGAALVAELETAVKHPKPIVRVNALRLLSIVGLIGYDKAAELALKVLQDPKEVDAVKLYALRTLTALFEYTANQAVPEQSVFRKEQRALEQRAIVFLCEYLMTPRDVANLSPEEIDAIRYVRREAVRALGFVRMPRLRYQGKTLAIPALVLLKVANKDGIQPEPDLVERAEAVTGFCQLFPIVKQADRDVQVDYGAWMVGNAILDITNVKVNVPNNIQIPWRKTAYKWDERMKQWAANVGPGGGMNLPGGQMAAVTYQTAQTDIFVPLQEAKAGNPPNTNNFRQWLQANKAKASQLFANEPNTTVNAVGAQP